MQNKKNKTLNGLKGIACFAVVMLHCSFPGAIGKIIYGISRFAVPLFFAISGYYVYSSDSKRVIQKLPQKIRHIGGMFLETEVLYCVWHCAQYFFLYGGIQGSREWISASFSSENLMDFLVFQRTFIGDISWFLVALILCYVLTFVLSKKNIWAKTFPMIPILLLINAFLGEIVPLFGVEIKWYWCSNFWLLGFPCYALGYYIRINEKKLVQVLTDRNIIVILILSILLNVVERAATDASQFFISNVPFMICCFVYCLKYPQRCQNNRIVEILSVVGEKYSFGVYILHPIVRDILRMIADHFGITSMPVWNWILPILIFGTSIFVNLIFRKEIGKRN